MHAAFIARVTWSFVVQVSAGAASLPDTQVPDGLYSLLLETQQENGEPFFSHTHFKGTYPQNTEMV